MKYTSAEAAKLLRKLNEDYMFAQNAERNSYEFTAATCENVDDVRPDYDFNGTQTTLADINSKIRKVKHAINVFNTTHIVPGFDMTVDEMLVYIPQLTQQKSKLSSMKARLPKARKGASMHGAGVIEYSYANYEIHDAETEYERVSKILSTAQLALDTLNNSETIDIDI